MICAQLTHQTYSDYDSISNYHTENRNKTHFAKRSHVYFYTQKVATKSKENSQNIVIMRKIDTVFSFILPVVLCLLLIIPLSIFLCASKLKCVDGILRLKTTVISVEVRLNSTRSQRRRYTECPSCSLTSPEQIRRQKLLLFTQSKRLTLTSVIVAIIFVILSIPHNLIKAKIAFLNGNYVITYEDQTFLKLFEELYKLNFVYKALVYFPLLPEMRKGLVRLLLCCLRRRPKPNKENKPRCIVTTF